MCTTAIFGVPTANVTLAVMFPLMIYRARVYTHYTQTRTPYLHVCNATLLRHHWEMGIQRLTSKARISRTNLQIYERDMFIMLLRGLVSGFYVTGH